MISASRVKINIQILTMEHEIFVLLKTLDLLILGIGEGVTVSILMNGVRSEELRQRFGHHEFVRYYESPANLGVAGGREFLASTSEAKEADVNLLLAASGSAPDDFMERRASQAEEALRGELAALRQEFNQRTSIFEKAIAKDLDVAIEIAKAHQDEADKAKETTDELASRLAGVEANLSKLRSQSVSLDLVSALRAMRPLWLGGCAVETLMQQPQIEHGHALLMAALADEARGKPDLLAGKTLIEIGSTRELDSAQSSTEKLAIFTTLTGMRFVTVDMDSKNINRIKQVLHHLNPGAKAIAAKGEDYLAVHTGSLDVVYLDAFDFDHGKHSDERKERYRTILHTDISDEACWRMHLSCAELLVARMPDGGIVAVDDTWTDDDGNYAGKGKLAIPFLLANGFQIIARSHMAIVLKYMKASLPPP